MPAPSPMEKRIEALAEPVCRAHGVELVQVRHVRQRGGAVLRVIIDRPRSDGTGRDGSGVSLDDCTDVSRDLGSALDVHEDLIPGHYSLEVSSPGLERPLVKLADFERFSGREARIQTKVPVHDRRRFKGRLLGVIGEEVEIEQDGTPVRISAELITKANLIHRF